jgi:conjugal transfer pilus assembly protein TraK
VTNEPVRGDIYLSVPDTYAARNHQLLCDNEEGLRLQIQRAAQSRSTPANIHHQSCAGKTRCGGLGKPKRRSRPAAVRLIQAMANNRTFDGYDYPASSRLAARVGDLEVQLIAEYRGSASPAKSSAHEQKRPKPLTLAESDISRRATRRRLDCQPTLKSGSQHHSPSGRRQWRRPAMTDAR